MTFPYTSSLESYYLFLKLLSVASSLILIGALGELLFRKGGLWETRFREFLPSDMSIWAYLKSRLSFPRVSASAAVFLLIFSLIGMVESWRVIHRNVGFILDTPEQLFVTSNNLYFDKSTLRSVMQDYQAGAWLLDQRDDGQHCFAVTVIHKSTQESLTLDFYRAS